MAPPTQEEFLKAWRELQLPGVPFDKEGYITDEAVKAWDYRQERDARLQQAKRDRPAAPAQAQALGYNIGGLPFQYPGPPPAPAALGVYDKPTKQWTGIEGPLLPRQRRLAMSGQDPTPYTRMPTEEEMWGPEKIFTEYLPGAYQSFTEFLSQTGAAAGLASGTVGGVPVSAPDLMTIAPFSPLTEEAKEEIRGVGAEAPLSRARDVRLQQERAREAGVDVSGFGQAIAPMMAAAQPLWEGFEHWGKVTAPLEGFLTSAIPENIPIIGGMLYEEDVRARYEQLRAMGLGHLEAYAAAYDQAVEAGDVGGLKQFLLSVGTDPIEFIPGVGIWSGLTKAGLSGTRALARGATGMGTPALAKTTERLALDVARTRLTPAKVVVNVMDTSPNTTTRGKGRAQLNVKAKLDKMEKGEATAGDRTYLRTHTGLTDTQLDDLFPSPRIGGVPGAVAKEPWQMTKREFANANPHGRDAERLGDTLQSRKDKFNELADDAEIIVFHATSDTNADALLAGRMIAPELQGGGIKGIDSGIYVGTDPVSVTSMGPRRLAITIKKSQLGASPEYTGTGGVFGALEQGTATGAIIKGQPIQVKDITGSGKLHGLSTGFGGKPLDVSTAHEALVTRAVTEGSPVSGKVLQDYPALSPGLFQQVESIARAAKERIRGPVRDVWGTPSPAEARPPEQWAARDRFERLIDQVPGTTTVKSQGGKADAWGRTSEMMAQLLAGETRVPARSAFTTPFRKINEETWLKEIAKHTNRDVSEIKALIDDTRAEFIGQAGKPQPLNPGVLDFRIWQSEGTMGRILKTPPGSKASHSLFVLYEGQVNQVDNELADLMRIARDRWTEQGGSYGKGFGAIVRGRWVPKSSKTAAGQEEIEILKTLFRALHDRTPENVNAIPSWLYDDFVDLVERTKGEEILRIDFNPKLAKVEDYFSRGWRFADNENGKLLKKANSKGMPLGTVKSYEKVRAGATFDEMLDAGFEPLYWNPYEVMVHSMKVSRRDRLQSQLIEDLMLNNVADVKVLKTVKDPITGELTGDVQIPAEPLRTRFRAGVVVGGETFMGFRVPKVGPAFEGRLRPPEAGGGITSQYALRNSLADRMENLFGAVPEWKIAGTDIMPAIRVATYLPKRAKLFGSWFQQRDFLQRNYGSTWSHAVDHLWHGAKERDPARIKAAALELAKWPESAGDILRSNFSPNYRKEIADWYLSTDEIIAGRPGINPSALVQSGLSTIDVTLLPTGIDNLAREVAQEAGYRLDKKMMRMVGDWESAMRQGLFEGVYPTAMKTDIINNIAPMYVRMAGHLTDDQLNGMIARAANIRYSTIPVSQSSIQWPWLRNFLKMFMFSLGESEGLIKQATKTMSGPDAAYWRKHWIGSYFSLLTTAEVIHWASTGEHLPVERWKPFEAVEDWDGPSWKTPLPFAYRRDFVSPDLPIKDRTGEQRLTLDLIGQMDTVLRMLSPADWVNSRRSVPVTAIAHQVTGKDFYGRYIDTYGPSLGPIDGLVSRTAVLIHDLGVPIGVGQAGTQLIREALPEKVFGVDVEKLIPQEGGRLGLAGLAIKGTGFLPRSPVTKDMQNLMVEKAIENDPAGAESLRIQQGAEFKNLTDIQENFVKGSPVNEGLMAEMELRGEELSLGRGDDVSLWFEHRRKIKEESTNELRRIEAEAYGLEYEWVDEEGNAQTKKFEGKINPDKWYADTVKQLGVARNLANKLEEHRKKATVSKREKGYGLKEDFLEKDISPDRTPDKQLEDELYELLFGDNEELHQSAEYFGGEEYVPIESDLGEFNSFEYQRRIDKINEVAVRRGLVRPGEDYVEIHRRAVLQNRVDWGNLPQVEMDRLLDRDFIAKNYWRASTDERLLALLPSDEVRDAWKKYVTLPEKDRREKDDDSRDIASKKHKVGRYRLTFEELYGHSAIRDERIRLRRNSLADGVEGLEHKLLKWGYVEDPVQEATINELLRGGRARGQAAKSPWAP